MTADLENRCGASCCELTSAALNGGLRTYRSAGPGQKLSLLLNIQPWFVRGCNVFEIGTKTSTADYTSLHLLLATWRSSQPPAGEGGKLFPAAASSQRHRWMLRDGKAGRMEKAEQPTGLIQWW